MKQDGIKRTPESIEDCKKLFCGGCTENPVKTCIGSSESGNSNSSDIIEDNNKLRMAEDTKTLNKIYNLLHLNKSDEFKLNAIILELRDAGFNIENINR